MIGAREMIEKLMNVAERFPLRVEAALYQFAQLILTEAKRRCPVAADGGVLRASGMVSEPIREGRNLKVIISFGGGAIAYAIAVHEHLSAHSPPSWIKAEESGHPVQWTTPGTGPKFLESVINEMMPGAAAWIAERIHLDKMA